MQVQNFLDLGKNELRNAKIYPLSAATISGLGLGAGDKGFAVYDITNNRLQVWNGTAFDTSTVSLSSVVGTSPIQVATASGQATVSIDAASGSGPGSMSAAHYQLLAGATSGATGSTLVQRDGSGNFSATTITASLTGTASNASALGGQAGSYYLSRANHTGTQVASTISDLATTVQGYRLDQFAVPTAQVNLNSQKIVNLATPSAATDAANKSYVDAVSSGMTPKGSARALASGNIAAMSGLSTIDSVSLATNDVVLLVGQTTASQNGPWVVSSGAWTRPTNFDSNAEALPGSFWFVTEGTVYQDTGWLLATDGAIVLGTTSLTLSQFSGPGSVIAGNGLSRTGNTFSAVGTANRITVGAGGIDIASNYVGQNTITTLGTIGTGIWNGTAVGIAYGGTGAATAPAARTALGAAAASAAFTLTGTGAQTSFTVTHNLAKQAHLAILTDASFNHVITDIAQGANSDTVTFGVAPANGVVYNLIVIG